MDALLRDVTGVTDLPDVDALGAGADPLEHTAADQSVVEDAITAREKLVGLEREQAGIAGTRPDEMRPTGTCSACGRWHDASSCNPHANAQ